MSKLFKGLRDWLKEREHEREVFHWCVVGFFAVILLYSIVSSVGFGIRNRELTKSLNRSIADANNLRTAVERSTAIVDDITARNRELEKAIGRAETAMRAAQVAIGGSSETAAKLRKQLESSIRAIEKIREKQQSTDNS